MELAVEAYVSGMFSLDLAEASVMAVTLIETSGLCLLPPGERNEWLAKLRDQVQEQKSSGGSCAGVNGACRHPGPKIDVPTAEWPRFRDTTHSAVVPSLGHLLNLATCKLQNFQVLE